jgi:hypothetical protein
LFANLPMGQKVINCNELHIFPFSTSGDIDLKWSRMEGQELILYVCPLSYSLNFY